MLHRLTRPRVAALLTALLLVLAAGGLAGGALLVAPAPAAAQVLGPGTPVIPGFSGYVLADGGELGIGRLPNGEFGVCTDTGGEFPWPDQPTQTLVTNPRTAYALGKYVAAARTDGRLAAALWWAVGADFGANSHAERVLAHVAQLRAADPGIWSDVKVAHDRIVEDATANAAPPHGYHLRIKLADKTVRGVGVKGGGDWLEGYPITLQITGPGRFDGAGADGRSWSGTTADRERTVSWTRIRPGKVVVRATVTGLPAREYERWWGGGHTQRVLAAAALGNVTDVDATVDQGREFLPLVVIKSAQDNDPAGLVGVGVEVHANAPDGPLVDAHVFTAADRAPSGAMATTFAASPPRCNRDCRYDPHRDYFVVIIAEPPGWNATTTVVQARLNDEATALVAGLSDLRVWNPTLVSQVSNQQAVPGETVRDVVTVAGTGGYAITAHWALLGPVSPVPGPDPDADPWSCAGADWVGAPLVASDSFLVAGDGDYTVGEQVVDAPGCYTYVESADSTAQTQPVPTTTAGLTTETTLVARQPQLSTQVSAQKAEVGVTLTDAVQLSGTGGAVVAGRWRLLGPIPPSSQAGAPPRTPSDCQGLDWSQAPMLAEGGFTATGDGTTTVGATAAPGAGCYTYVEQLAATETTRAVDWTVAGSVPETSLVTQTPELVTQVSEQAAHVGAVLHDTVRITNTGGVPTSGRWRLLGPLAPLSPVSGFSCTGADWATAAVAAEGEFTVAGDGSQSLGEFAVTVAGCYTYVESLAGTATTEELPESRPGQPTETAIVTQQPTLVTRISDQAAQVGKPVHDRVLVSGTGGATVSGHYWLLGPLTPPSLRAERPCQGLDWEHAPVAAIGSFSATGDGEVEVGEHVVTKPGCYTYGESLDQSATTDAVPILPGLPAETTLASGETSVSATVSPPVSPPVPTTPLIEAGGGGPGPASRPALELPLGLLGLASGAGLLLLVLGRVLGRVRERATGR